MPNLKPIEIILILAVILLLFGAKRLPDAARGLGRSLRIFKSEVKAAQDDEGNSPPQQIEANPSEVSTTPVTPPAPQQASQPTTTPESGSTER
jgi:sec-independent protein translocase protein TatA